MAACNRNCIHRQENRELVLRRQIEICVKDCFDNYLLHNMGASRYPMAERLAASGFPVKCETRSWRSISVVLSEELRRPWRRSPKIIQIVELVQLQRNCPDWEFSPFAALTGHEAAIRETAERVEQERDSRETEPVWET